MKAAPDTEPDRLVQDSIDVELLLLCGAKWITVRPDQTVWLAVADALGCRVRLVNQIMFGNEPVPQGESFDSIGMADGGHLGVDYSTEGVDTLEGHIDSVWSVCALLDGNLASGSVDKSIKIWDLPSGQCIQTLKGHTRSVCSVCALPDGNLASGSSDNSIKIWDLPSGQCIQTLNGHTRPVWSVCALPGGSLASGSVDKSIKIWDF